MKKPTKRPFTDLRFITSSIEWPNWPVLPVVRIGEPGRCGLVYADEQPVVYLDANMFRLSEKVPEAKSWGEALAPYERKVYADFASLLSEWRID